MAYSLKDAVHERHADVARKLTDGFGRGITYLRISVTDKCNFRCVYCMPKDGVPARNHDELLRAEEIAHFVRIAAEEGITHVRLTGGEPLVSHRIVPLIEQIKSTSGIKDVSLTTNGALLPSLAPQLKAAGLDRVNISLDTLDPGQFAKITRCGNVEQALAGIDAALDHGFDPVKINTVVVRRMYQDVFELAKLSLERPVHVRFIEYMPIGGAKAAGVHDGETLETDQHGTCAGNPDPHCGASAAQAFNPNQWDASDVIPSEELRNGISEQGVRSGIGALEPVDKQTPEGAGPAEYWAFPDAKGTVGFISAMSNHFCSGCNRLRLTSDGSLRPCLFSDTEYQVRDALRAGDEEAIRHIFRTAIGCKPKEYDHTDGTLRSMSQIGG